MNNRSWTMVLVSLVVLLGGCGTPDVESEQPEQALHATPAASGEILALTVASSPTVEEPVPTDTLLPTAEEPTSTSTPLPTSAPPTVASSATPVVVHTVEDVPRITPAEAKELLDGGMALLYDTRSAGQYRTLHAAGALSYPASDMAARYGELPTDKSLVFYWTWPHEGTSARVALYVISQGMDPANVYALLGGLAAWEAAGYPLESGDDWPFVGTGWSGQHRQFAHLHLLDRDPVLVKDDQGLVAGVIAPACRFFRFGVQCLR